MVDGNTVSDAEPDEQARQMSISTTLSSFEWDGRKINLLDTPGEPSFVADALGALRVCESAIFVVNAVMGVEVSTARLWARAAELDIARMLFVNMLDRERADFFRTLEQLKGAFGQHVVATEIPMGSEHELSGVIDLVDMRAFRQDSAQRRGWTEIEIPAEHAEQAAEYREKLMDEVAEVSDALMERYLEGEEISHEEIVGALKEGTNHGAHLPGGVRGGDAQPRHHAAAGGDRRGPALAGEARCAGGGRGKAGPGGGGGAVRVRVQDPRGPVRGADQPAAGLPGRRCATTRTCSTPAPT